MTELNTWFDDNIYIPMLKPGKKLYHYTSAAGLEGICTKNEFWATEYHFLNDSTEFQIGTEVFCEVLSKNITDSDISSTLISNLRAEMTRLETPGELGQKIAYSGKYVISFCLDNDSILMWSEYSDFMGYCMKFDFTKLLNSFSDKLLFHGRVIYNHKKQIQCIEKTINDCFFIDEHYGYLNNWTDFNKLTPDQLNEFMLHSSVICIAYNMFFKKEYFSGEHEYRFVFDCIHDGGLVSAKDSDKQYFRIKDETLIPYVKKSISSLNSLESVLVGPKNKSDIAVKGLEYFFRNLKINVNVAKSEMPLRY